MIFDNSGVGDDAVARFGIDLFVCKDEDDVGLWSVCCGIALGKVSKFLSQFLCPCVVREWVFL